MKMIRIMKFIVSSNTTNNSSSVVVVVQASKGRVRTSESPMSETEVFQS